MSKALPITVAIASLVAAAIALPTPTRAAQARGDAEHFTALAVNLGTAPDVRPMATESPVDITIERWSTDSERERFYDALARNQDALLSAFQDGTRVGFIKTPDQRGYDLKYARQIPEVNGARRIVIATDRPMGFWEIANRPRTADYPFAVIELRLSGDGKGEGKMSLATKITTEKDHTIVLENYLSDPVMLQDVKTVKR